MPVILGANSASGGYNITNSLRFNSGSSDSLSRTPASAGNRRTYTISAWFKRSTIGVYQYIIGATTDAFDLNWLLLYINTDDKLAIAGYTSSGSQFSYRTTQVFRDVSAWYHVVVAIDTTQATASNRVKLYVNGSQVTAFDVSTEPTQNIDTYWNSNVGHYIGQGVGANYYFNGYTAEIYNIDGQALTPSSFGETDEDTGIWKPKAFSGTYGTNGFYLQFKNSSSLGTDSSGNGNNFTVNNLTSVDQTTDTPTNNFATMNPLLNRYSSGTGYLITFSEGNLKTTADNTSVYTNTGGTFQLTQGKWYWEAKNGGTGYTAFPTACSIGIHDLAAGFNGTAGTDTLVRGYNADGTKNSNDSTSSYGNSFVSGDIIMVALDLDNGKIWFGKNGTWQNSGSPTGGTNAAFTDLLSVSATGWSPWTQGYRGSSGVNVVFDWNFGNPPYSANSYQDANGFGNFSYSVPSGYYSLCTKNLYQYGF